MSKWHCDNDFNNKRNYVMGALMMLQVTSR